METKQCSRCFEVRPLAEYTRNGPRLKSWCKSCRAESARFRRLVKARKPLPLPLHLVKPVNYLKRLTESYSPPQALELPVRVVHNTVPYPRACVLQRIEGRDWYCIASRRGSRQLARESTGPVDLLEALGTLGLELILPEVQSV